MHRQRLTITLKKDLLTQVDKKIDGVRIRNRSHAIEYLLTKSIGSKISQAFILAGGKGLKMRPFTYEMPKSMIPIADRPILEYIIELLRNHGIKNIFIGVDYLSKKIKEYFGDGSKFGVSIKYIDNKTPLGTGGALKSAKNYLEDADFLLINGDLLVDIDIVDMIEFAEEEKAIITMALTSIDDPSLYGSVRLRGAQVVEFFEKPVANHHVSRLINAGVYVMSKKIFQHLPNKKIFSLEKDVIPELIQSRNVSGYHFAGYWYDISTPEIYGRAVKDWKNRKILH
jgi:NDP-sugar pyrophosphorylase family protein